MFLKNFPLPWERVRVRASGRTVRAAMPGGGAVWCPHPDPLPREREILQKHFATLPFQTRHLHLNRLSLLLCYNI